MSFWGELKRRDVFKVAVAYLVASWLIVQVVGVLTEPLSLPDALDTAVIVLLAVGFPFALIVAWVYEVTPEGIRVTDVDDSRPALSGPSRRLSYVVTGLFVIAVAFTLLGNYVLTPSSTQFGAGSRLAVLPCDDLSPDPTNSYFAAGIHDELLTRLQSLSGLEVISRTSVLQYAGRRPPVPQIAEQLNADAIMECTARYSGDRVMVTAELIDGASDTHLWAGAFPGDMSDLESLFEIQTEIAMNVANALHVEFFEAEREQIGRASTQSREAYELYLAARAIGSILTLQDGERALALLDHALMLDPLFVDAWFQKNAVHNIIAALRSGEAVRTEYDQAIEAARRVLAIEPQSGRGNAMLGFSLGQMGVWPDAEQEYRKALERGVRLEDVPPYAVLQMAVGDFEGARDTLQANLRIDPMNPVAAGFSLVTLAMTGDGAARRRAYERGERLYGNWFGDDMEFVLRMGERDTKFMRATEFTTRATLDATALKANLDSPAGGVQALHELYRGSSNHSPRALVDMAEWAAYFGDDGFSLQLLRESYSRGSRSNVWVIWLPLFDEVRSSPGFKTLLEELELPAYWRRFGWPPFCHPLEGEDFACR